MSSKNKGRGGGEIVAFAHPPPIRAQITHKQRMRYQCNTTGSQTVTFQNILDGLLLATSATAVYDMFDVVKIDFVEMWVGGSAAVPVTVTVDFIGGVTGAGGDGVVWSDTSMSIQPAHVKARPSKMCPAALWQQSSTAPAFSLPNCPVGAIIDVMCSFKNANVPPVLAQVVAVGAQVGQLYYRGLDGVATATTKFPALAVEFI